MARAAGGATQPRVIIDKAVAKRAETSCFWACLGMKGTTSLRMGMSESGLEQHCEKLDAGGGGRIVRKGRNGGGVG